MTKYFKAGLVSLAIIASATSANAGGKAQGFDVDHLMQSIEAGTVLYRY